MMIPFGQAMDSMISMQPASMILHLILTQKSMGIIAVVESNAMTSDQN